MRVNRPITAVLAGSLAVAALSACGGSSSGTSTTKTSASGVLNISMPDGASEKDNNNPYLATSAASHLGYRYVIYEPLAMVNLTDPNSKPAPWLSTAWTFTPDYKSVTFTVRDGVKFSDGTAMSADDVAYSFSILKQFAALNSNALPIDTVSTSGTKVTVTFTQSVFVIQAKVLSTFVIPKHIWSAIKDPTTDTVANPVGTGPYTLKTFTPQTISLDVRTSGYWQTLPKVAQLRYSTYTGNDTETQALVTGATEWSYVFIPDAKTIFAGRDPHYKLWFPPSLSADGLWFNTTIKPWDNQYLRQAAGMVINRADIFNQGESGYFKPEIDNVTGLPSPAGDSFVASQYKGVNGQQPAAAAKTLLTSHGFTYNGTTLMDPSGKAVTLTVTDPAGWSDYQTDLSIIQDNFKSIGIAVTINKADADAWFTAIANGSFQAAMHWSNGGSTPYDMYENIMDGASLEPIGTAANSGNYGRFNSAAATQALKDYANATDDATRTTAMATIEQIMVEQAPMIPTSAGNYGAEYSTKHWTGWPDASNPYSPIQPTLTQSLDVIMHLSPATSGPPRASRAGRARPHSDPGLLYPPPDHPRSRRARWSGGGAGPCPHGSGRPSRAVTLREN
jgi:peptide/nickel transport system substrate-binding protein